MNMTQLTVFREIMLSGSVSQAARNLGRTQPAISSTLATLEAGLGFQLFERRGKRLYPVPEAHYLLEEATQILDQLTTTERNIQNLKALQSGELRIVAMPGPSVFLVPQLVSQIAKNNNDIRATVVTRSSPQVHQLVSTQSYDVGIADLGVEYSLNTSLVRSEPFASDCLFAVPANDPMAQKKVLQPADLNGRPLATLHREHHSHREIRRAFQVAGAELVVRFETQYYLPLLTYVEEGLACAIVDTLTAETYRHYRGEAAHRVIFRPFSPEITLSFATLTPAHRPPSQLAQAFISLWRAKVDSVNSHWNANER